VGAYGSIPQPALYCAMSTSGRYHPNSPFYRPLSQLIPGPFRGNLSILCRGREYSKGRRRHRAWGHFGHSARVAPPSPRGDLPAATKTSQAPMA